MEERKKTGPTARIPTEEEIAWMVKPFPASLKEKLKDRAHDHRMSLREYVIMVLRERVATEESISRESWALARATLPQKHQ